MKSSYKAVLDDLELVSRREGLGPLTVRTTELLDRLGKIEAPAWGEAPAAVRTLRRDEGRQVSSRPGTSRVPL
jgi:hypothetical protein